MQNNVYGYAFPGIERRKAQKGVRFLENLVRIFQKTNEIFL